MSSIGSVSSIEKSLIYKQKLQHFHTPGFSVFQGRIPCSFRIKCLFHKVYNGESFLRFSMNNKDIHSAIFVSKSKILRAVKEPATEGENEDDTEDAVKATIEKSRKVLAMQKDLLQQIAERKKLVSAIKSSIANADGEVISYSENDNDILYKDVIQDSTNGELDRENLTRIVSDGFSDAEKSVTSDELQIEKDPNKDEHKEITSSNVKFLDVTKESIFLPTKSKAAPSITREIVSSSIKEDEEPKASDDLAEIDSSNEKEEAKPPPLAGKNVMNIIVVAAECAPWSKTGGLGDVAGSLPKALARRGHRVMVVAPRYGNYSEPKETGIYKKYMVDGQEMEVSYFQAYIDDVDFVFIDSGMFQNREKNIYGGERVEILKRMTLFCKAAVEVPWHVPCGGVCYGDGNLVFIANDWHTALLPVYLKAYYRDNGLMNYTRSVLVIHNIAHQGRGPVDDFRYVDLPEHYRDLFTLSDPIGGDHFNIFAAGLKTADRIVTVSNGYSWELKTSEGGWGLHQIINENNWKFRGIVNGIDTKEWNPELDVHLKSDDYTNYTLDTLQTGKPKCKAALQKELGLPIRSEVPLIGFIGRLDHQKGVDLIAEAIPWMLGQDVQLVMLGTGRSDLEDLLRQFERQNHDKIRSWVGFSVRTAHRITAGADILLMPSRFEPCGLNQLYAMMYGTIPVVHAVGGLRDTVQPFDPYKESGFGWTFDRAETPKLIHALGNCLLTYREFKNSWKGLQTRGMTQDLSWDKAAQLYEEELIAAKYQW